MFQTIPRKKNNEDYDDFGVKEPGHSENDLVPKIVASIIPWHASIFIIFPRENLRLSVSFLVLSGEFLRCTSKYLC